MPLHDWTRVDDERYHDFHNGWIIAIRDELNDGLLPDDCEAVSESTVGISRDDPDDRSQHRFPDVGTLQFENPPYGGASDDGAVLAVLDAPPQVAVELSLDRGRPRPKRVLIRRGGGELIAAIEIASPSNLKSEAARQELADKCRDLLRGGVHVCVFDPFPAAGRRPTLESLTVEDAAAEWQEPRSPDQGLAASYVSGGPGRMRTAYLQPLTVGEPLPAMPVFLTPGEYVSLTLEDSYGRAFAGVGRSVRRLLKA